MRVLIAQNTSREKPGLIEYVLKERRAEFDVVDLNEEEFPEPSNYDAVFVMGGPDSAKDNTPKIKKEIQRVKKIISSEIPYFGICLGMQVLVKAGSGEVYPNHIREVGCKDDNGKYYEVELTAEGVKDLILEKIKSPFRIFQLHGETAALKSGMKLLGIGKHCKNQIVKVGSSAYGIQGHLEITEQMLEDWLAEDPMFDGYDKSAISNDFRNAQAEYRTNGLKLINNFLDIAERQKEKKLLKLAV